jgi:hypothetical protein
MCVGEKQFLMLCEIAANRMFLQTLQNKLAGVKRTPKDIQRLP